MHSPDFQTRIVDSFQSYQDAERHFGNRFLSLGGARWAWQKGRLLAHYVQRCLHRDVRCKVYSANLQKGSTTAAPIGSKNVDTEKPARLTARRTLPRLLNLSCQLSPAARPRLQQQTSVTGLVCRTLASQTRMPLNLRHAIPAKTGHICKSFHHSVLHTVRQMPPSFMADQGTASGGVNAPRPSWGLAA